MEHVVRHFRPSPLSADDRAEVIGQIEDGASPSRRFYTLTVLATAIAVFGLLTNSSATIIGAMIVEPSMSPILGLALGLVRFDRDLKVKSLIALGSGIVLTLLLGFLIGKMPLDLGITNEMIVRSRPTLIDMAVAVASGLAGGYGYVNPKVNPALAGVAISVSLAPPLAACGLFLAISDPKDAAGAMLMFLANLICIQLAAVGVFWFYRLGTARKARRAGFSAYVAQFTPYVLVMLAIGWVLTVTLIGLVAESRDRQAVKSALDILKRDHPKWEISLELMQPTGFTPSLLSTQGLVPRGTEVMVKIQSEVPPSKTELDVIRAQISGSLGRVLPVEVVFSPIERFYLKDKPES